SLSGSKRVQFSLIERGYAFGETGYPVTCWMEGSVGADDGCIFVDWYEPFANNRELNFPVYPGRFVLTWDKDKMQSQMNGNSVPNQVEFADSQKPVFDNAPEFYSFFDSLRPRLALAKSPEIGTADDLGTAGAPQLVLQHSNGERLRQT